jgi:hypothetical protein
MPAGLMDILFGGFRVDTGRMSFLLYATNLLMLVSFVVFAWQVARAPEGHQDAMGFHFGSQVPDSGATRSASARKPKAGRTYGKVAPRHLAA